MDELDGGAGKDWALYTDSAAGIAIDLSTLDADGYVNGTGGHAQGDKLKNIKNLWGSEHGDYLTGDDRMYGGNGDDRVFGGRGNDTLTGGEGNDVLKSGPGEDTIIVDGDDMDVLYGGPDKDTFLFFPSDLGGGSIRDFRDGEDVTDLTVFTGISSMDDLEIISHGENVQIEVSGTDYLTTIILWDFDVGSLDNSDFLI